MEASASQRLSPQIEAGAFGEVASRAAAEEFTRQLTHSHYENFSVVSMLLPRHLRQEFCNVYAFCRVADDLGDEAGDCARSMELLARFRQETLDCYVGKAHSPVFVALSGTIARFDIPSQPFLDLIDAFEQDQRVQRYDTFAQVLDYCRRSANPVGRLVLYICGYREEQRQRLSDCTCSALQLANFWQDIRRDLMNLDRIYLPRDSMRQFDLSDDELAGMIREQRCDQRCRDLVRFEVDRTQRLFDQGRALLPLLDSTVRPQIALFGRGGEAILTAIRQQNYDTISHRPVLSKWQKSRLILRSLPGLLWSRLLGVNANRGGS